MMKSQSVRKQRCSVVLATLLAALGSASALAAPPAGTPYYTDPQNSYVEDATSKGIGQVNMITCFITSMKPADLVNQPNYIALVDQKKCDSSSRSDPNNQGASNGADSPSYMRAIVSSTRASNADPMLVKVWVDDTIGNNTAATIFVKASATQAPSTVNPYGVFRLDFCGKAITDLPTAACAMFGYIDASATGLQYFQNEDRGGGDSSLTQLALTQGSGGDLGSGRLSMVQLSSGQTQSSEFSFAYNATNYLRSDGTNNLCFSRTEANADKSVWRYGLYKGDGTALDIQSGFPVTWTDTSTSPATTYQGQIGYYGLWMQDNRADSVPNGATLTKQSFGQGATGQNYTLARAGGRLSKFVKQSTTLDNIANVKLSAGFNTTVAFNVSIPMGFNNIEMYWDKLAGQFMQSGTNVCGGPNGCQLVPVTPPTAIANANWANVMGGVFGYSQTLGGEVRIGDLSALSGATHVDYRQQSLVYPSDMPASLYCLGECADFASMSAFFTNAAGTPWVLNTGSAQFTPQGVLLTDLVTYDANTTTGLISAAGMNAPMVVTDATWLASKPQYQWGFRNGKMFADPTAVLCTGSADHYCGNKVEDLPTYYVWETGTSAFNQFFALTTTNGSNCGASPDKYCRFDAPLQVTYSVPTGAEFGTYAGQQIVLQYGGYGNLWGIPGVCVDRFTNATVDCSQSNQNTRFVPAFVIPFDATLGVVTAGSTSYYVRWLDREVRFAQVSGSQCSALTLTGATGLTLPDVSNFLYPGVSTSANYIGAEPTVTDAPRVIGGVIMY